MRKEKNVCCICRKPIEGFGNNPAGAAWMDLATGEPTYPEFGPEDRCCDDCNRTYVIPGRISRMVGRGEAR